MANLRDATVRQEEIDMPHETNRRIGVGLLSAGWMGTVHSRGYTAVPDKYPDLGVVPDLVAVADTSQDAGRRAVDRLGYRRATTDYRQVLADPEIDVVSICAPNYLHRQFALAAVEAHKPFWIEKPMGVGLADSAAIADAVETAGLVTCVGFNYRHAPAVELARRMIRGGELGTITNVRCRLDADYSSDPTAPRTWRFVAATAGTGVLGDLLSHGIDLVQYLGGAIHEVIAATGTFITQRPEAAAGGVGHQVAVAEGAATLPVENEDYAAIIARLDSGAIATLESSRIAIGPRCEYGFAVYGTKGSLVWDFERMNELRVCLGRATGQYGYTRVLTEPGHGDFGRFQPGAGMGLSFDDLKTIEAYQFLASVVSGRQLAPSVADGLAAASVVDAAAQSALDGTWHTVPAPIGSVTFDD